MAEFSKTIAQVQETMKNIPNKGFGFSALKYLKKSPMLLNRTSDVVFNHLGTFGAEQPDVVQDWDFISDEPTGTPVGTSGLRTHVIDINSSVMSSKLSVFFGYSKNIHNEQQVSELARSFESTLKTYVSGTPSSQTPIILVHPVDGNISGLTALGETLNRPYLVLSYPEPSERDGKQFASLQEMAKFQISEIRKSYPQGPYIFVGYSFGGVLAYAIITELVSQQVPIEGYVLLDQSPPANNLPPPEFNNYGQFLTHLVENLLQVKFTKDEKDQMLHTKGTPILPARISYTLEDVQKEFISHRSEIYNACFSLFGAYSMPPDSPKLNIPILVVAANSPEERPEDLGWRSVSTKSVSCEKINAHHYDILGKESLLTVSSFVSQFLEKL